MDESRPTLRFCSTVSEAEDPATLRSDLLAGVSERLGHSPDLLVLFFTAPLRDLAGDLAAALREALGPRVFVGVSCEGVIGADREVERAPGAALFAGLLAGITLRPFHIGVSEWQRVLDDDERLQLRVGTGADHRGQLLLGDPFTTPVDALLERLDTALAAPTFGGMASGAHQPGGNLLLLDDQQFSEGAVGVGFGGSLTIDTIVSQGCRPVGEPMVVTRAGEGFILELGRRPALEVAQEMLQRLSPEDQELLRGGLFVGVVIDEYRDTFERGDFLVRNLMGIHRDTGGLAVGDIVRPGQTVQFHVRDAGTATEELLHLLEPAAGKGATGGLLFSCNGRGTRMFPSPHHDLRTTHSVLPGLPLAGFFAMGELGPVGGKCFIHGHTASLALFRNGH